MDKTIALITDIHLDEETTIHNGVDPDAQWKLILDEIVSKKVDEIVFAGDIGAPSSYKFFFESLKQTKIPCYVILGNHDTYTEAIKCFDEERQVTNDELYFSFEDDIYLYIFMDSSSTKISDEQFNWLSQKINNEKKIIIFIHHPVLSVETMVDTLYPLQNREEIKKILQKISNEITIFSGHYHASDERTDKNIRQILTPAASFQITKHTREIVIDNSVFGYRIIHIDDNSIDTEVILHSH